MPKRSLDELKELLEEQIDFIKKSCALYDAVDKGEAKRIATHIHTIVHDKGRTISILTQMGLRNNLKFFSPNNVYRPGNILSETHLCKMQMNAASAEYLPKLEDVALGWNLLSFSRWWEEPILVIRKKETNEISRRKIIHLLRDQDGGSHLDSNVSKDYVDIKSGEALGWQFSVNGYTGFVQAPHYASVRHIAHEILKTLDKK